MRILKSTLFRALCAIAIGYMLIEYPEDMRHGFIRAIGALFLASGAISWASYLHQKKNAGKTEVFDAEGNKLTQTTPFFPIAGSGSIILGLILIVVPGTLENVLNIIFGAMIILGAFNQFITLMKARQYSLVPVAYWVITSILFLFGILIILKPSFISETVSFFMVLCGWCFVAYAFVELLLSVQLAIFKHKYNKANEQMKIQKAEEENEKLLSAGDVVDVIEPVSTEDNDIQVQPTEKEE
ncbi:MAG: DUF308 domain-containing protein [Bacteroidaceae bacterium]|nr:DUF308 domain-containing protein [Bacteroidaceae bacterium]